MLGLLCSAADTRLAPRSRAQQKFLLPHLQPPSQTDLEASQAALTAKYDEAAELLRSLQTSTDVLAQSLDDQKAQVENELAEVKAALEEVRQGERQRNTQMDKVASQVDDIVKQLPQVSCLRRPSQRLT